LSDVVDDSFCDMLWIKIFGRGNLAFAFREEMVEFFIKFECYVFPAL